MKNLKYFLIILIISVPILLFFTYQNAKNNLEIPNVEVSINNEYFNYEKVSYEKPVLPQFLPNSFRNLWRINGEQLHNTNSTAMLIEENTITINCAYNYTYQILDNNNVIFTGNSGDVYTFTDSGEYKINVYVKIDNELGYDGKYEFLFSRVINIDLTPYLTISNKSPIQGELVKVDITNVKNINDISIDCEFSPSGVTLNNGTASFYVPITYYKNAVEYPLNIQVNTDNNIYEFNEVLSVQADEFSSITFSASSSVVAQTVQSQQANAEYRNIIHPLYYTKDENVYWSEAFIKPVEETRVSSPFGQIRYENGSSSPSRHSGIDYAAPLGTPVYAANTGKIEYAGFLQLSGNTIVIEHGLGLKSYYFHMDSLSVNTGDMVTIGDYVGTVGTTGYSTGPHLHYQISIQNQPVNPNLLYAQ